MDQSVAPRRQLIATHGEGTFHMFEVPIPALQPKLESHPLAQPEALAQIALIYRQRNEQAIQVALQADPNNPLAIALSGHGDLKSAMKARPDDWRAYYILWHGAGDAKALEKAAQLAPQNATVAKSHTAARGETRPGRSRLANAVSSPTRSDSHAALISSSSCNSAAYQRVENRVHTVTSCDSLNEYTTRLTIGT